MRAPSESKPFALSVSLVSCQHGCCMQVDPRDLSLQILGTDQSVMVVVAASDEEELTRWMQTLCEAVIEKEVRRGALALIEVLVLSLSPSPDAWFSDH